VLQGVRSLKRLGSSFFLDNQNAPLTYRYSYHQPATSSFPAYFSKMFDLVGQDSEFDVFPQTLDLFSDDNDLLKSSKEERSRGRKGSQTRWSDAEIRVLLSAFSKQKNLNHDELVGIAAQMRQGNTPSSVNKWFKSCRANQRKVVKQERAKHRDARYTKAK